LTDAGTEATATANVVTRNVATKREATGTSDGRPFSNAQAIRAITHQLCRLIWKILHERVRYEERGPAVSAEAKKVPARKKRVRGASRETCRAVKRPNRM